MTWDTHFSHSISKQHSQVTTQKRGEWAGRKSLPGSSRAHPWSPPPSATPFSSSTPSLAAPLVPHILLPYLPAVPTPVDGTTPLDIHRWIRIRIRIFSATGSKPINHLHPQVRVHGTHIYILLLPIFYLILSY